MIMASMTAPSSSARLCGDIDDLLERYLGLLDQYATLRHQLSTIQSSVHQHIARANFTSERGFRYGQDNYDERIQAIRTCRVTGDPKSDNLDANPPVFEVSLAHISPENDTKEQKDQTSEQPEYKVKDPIRMFGILVPQALRAAQADAIEMVERIIPEIASIDAEMKGLEIQIRRKRKHKAKAEALEVNADAGGQKPRDTISCGS